MLPGVAPGLDDWRELLAPLLLERLERRQAWSASIGGVDRPEILGDLVVLRGAGRSAGYARMRCTMQVCTVVFGKTASIASGKPCQPVDAADQDVPDAAVLELGEDLHPELRALRFLEPHAEHVAARRPSRTPSAR